MKVKELIKELLEQDLEAEVKLYSLIDIECIDSGASQFEFISDTIDRIDFDSNEKIVYIDGTY